MLAVMAVAAWDIWRPGQTPPPAEVEPAVKAVNFGIESQGETLTIAGAVVTKQDDGLIVDADESGLFKITLATGEQIRLIENTEEKPAAWEQVESGAIVKITVTKEEQDNNLKRLFMLTKRTEKVEQATESAQ